MDEEPLEIKIWLHNLITLLTSRKGFIEGLISSELKSGANTRVL